MRRLCSFFAAIVIKLCAVIVFVVALPERIQKAGEFRKYFFILVVEKVALFSNELVCLLTACLKQWLDSIFQAIPGGIGLEQLP
ncbi:hypothetical protein FQZ97_973870 [compost metagenome]